MPAEIGLQAKEDKDGPDGSRATVSRQGSRACVRGTFSMAKALPEVGSREGARAGNFSHYSTSLFPAV